MSDDIVKWLRDDASSWKTSFKAESWWSRLVRRPAWYWLYTTAELERDAADEIERLRAALREIRDAPVTALRTVAVRDIAHRALEGTE